MLKPKSLSHKIPNFDLTQTQQGLKSKNATNSLWGFLQLKSELIRKAETQKIREKQTNMALFLRRKSLNNLKNDE